MRLSKFQSEIMIIAGHYSGNQGQDTKRATDRYHPMKLGDRSFAERGAMSRLDHRGEQTEP